MTKQNNKPKTGARESAALQDCTGTVQPQGTPRTCNKSSASPCNTADAKYIHNKHIQPLRCAVDSLYISYRGTLNAKSEEFLTAIKKMAQKNQTETSSNAFINIEDHKFEVSPKGTRGFNFILKDNWFQIQLSSEKSSSMPLAYIQISSELLTFSPLDAIIRHLDWIISNLGKVRGQATISRLDLCMDFVPSFDIENIDIKQWKTRATQIDRYHQHKRVSGWRIGKGAVMGRLYNKSLELKKSKKLYMMPLWESQGWDTQSDVWRMEFQMKREFLSKVGLGHPEQIEELSPRLWKYATNNWLQLVTPTNDSNESRWPVTDEWKEIAQSCTSTECEAVKVVTKKRIPNDKYLFLNGISAISSFMAREGINNLGEALGEFLHQAEDFHMAYHDQNMETYLIGKAKEKSLRYNTKIEE